MVPAEIVLIPRVPLTPNGKLDRAALPAPAAAAPPEPGGAARATRSRSSSSVGGRRCSAATVGIHDNFFELGGYSLLATRLFAMIEAGTGLQHPPVGALRGAHDRRAGGGDPRRRRHPEWPSLVPIQPAGTQRPFFYVAPYMISVLQLAHLGVELGEDQPLYGLQPQGLDGVLPAHTRIEEMADAYIRQIRSVQPHGPYRIGGHCSGAWVAFEMARQLEAAGEQLDPVAARRPGPARRRAAADPAAELPRSAACASTSVTTGCGTPSPGRRRIMINRIRIRRMWSPSSEHVEKVRAIHRVAYRQYRKSVVDSDLVLVRSDESIALADKFWYLQWRERTRGSFHEVRSDGTHANLLERPYVVSFADRLRWAFSRSKAPQDQR